MKSTILNNDIFTASDKNFSINSKYAQVKMLEEHVDVLDYTFASNPGADTTTTLLSIEHGFSYTPLSLVYVKDVDNGTFNVLRYRYSVSLPSGAQEFMNYTDDTYFKILYVVTDAPTEDVTSKQFIFKYFVWVETGMN